MTFSYKFLVQILSPNLYTYTSRITGMYTNDDGCPNIAYKLSYHAATGD